MKIKEKIDIVNSITELLGEAFYCISMWDHHVTFQGKYNSSIAKRCHAAGYKSEIDSDGYVILIGFQKEIEIRIVLT